MANIGAVVSILAKSIPFRKEFNLATKESKETPTEWLARVKILAELCSFGQCQNLFILDKFLTGFDMDIINLLCSAAEDVDIELAMEIIEPYSMQKKVDATEAIFMHDEKEETKAGTGAETLKFDEQTNPAISEVLVVKYENNSNDDGDDANNEYPSENDFFNDLDDNNAIGNTNDVDYNSSGSRSTNNTKDSDYVPSDIEKDLKKQAKDEIKKKKQQTKLAKQMEKPAAIDPNAPRKRRKYKPRPRKEKETFECDICHYKVNHKCHLARHMLIHLNEKSFICHECGKGFNLFINLNAHLRRHAGVKPHACNMCNASFIDRTRLELHTLRHTGERPHGCTICEKRFIDRHYLKIHMRSHTGEKPYKCDKCQRTFTQSSSLSLHKRKSCLLNVYNSLERY